MFSTPGTAAPQYVVFKSWQRRTRERNSDSVRRVQQGGFSVDHNYSKSICRIVMGPLAGAGSLLIFEWHCLLRKGSFVNFWSRVVFMQLKRSVCPSSRYLAYVYISCSSSYPRNLVTLHVPLYWTPSLNTSDRALPSSTPERIRGKTGLLLLACPGARVFPSFVS